MITVVFLDQVSFTATPISATKSIIVKYMLNSIFFDNNPVSFRYNIIKDLIIVIEELVNYMKRNLFTLDKVSLNFRQIRSINGFGQLKLVRYTNFLHYRTISGIMVPSRMSFENPRYKEADEYLYVSFESFNPSILNKYNYLGY